MIRSLKITGLAALLVILSLPLASAAEISGHYMEARTCQVYTGPCFAAGEVGLAGKEAIMAWSIEEGKRDGVDLAGLNVVVVVRSTKTMAFRGLEEAGKLRSLIVVDEAATSEQRLALIDFAKEQSGKAGKNVVGVQVKPIEMSLDTTDLSGKLKAGRHIELITRKANKGDCICSNESAYYPPLAKVENFVPGVTIEGGFTGRGLGTRWTIPDTRSSYMATFAY